MLGKGLLKSKSRLTNEILKCKQAVEAIFNRKGIVLSKTNNLAEPKTKKSSQKSKFETKPIINSSLYFSKDGKYLIFEKTEKHLFPASYHLKLLDSEIVKTRGEQQCAN